MDQCRRNINELQKKTETHLSIITIVKLAPLIKYYLLDGGGAEGVAIEFWSTRNIHNPGTPTLLVVSMFTIVAVCEPGILK